MNYSTQQQSGCKKSMCSSCGMGMNMRMPMDMNMNMDMRMPMDMDMAPILQMPHRNNSDFDNFPLAMAYVPWQCWNQVYDLEEGFQAGTIFPELNLPFTGRCMTNAN